MVFTVDNERKVACWFFTNAEQEDAAGMEAAIETIRPQFAEWKAKGYMPAIFRSGKADLEDTMYGLIKHNYMVMARKELAEEKAAAEAAISEAVSGLTPKVIAEDKPETAKPAAAAKKKKDRGR